MSSLFSRKRNLRKKEKKAQKNGSFSPLSSVFNTHINECPRTNPYLFLRNLNLTVVDLLHHGSGVLTVHSATDRANPYFRNTELLASAEDLLHSSGELVGVGTLTEDLGDLDHLIESEVAAVLNYSLLVGKAKYCSYPSFCL